MSRPPKRNKEGTSFHEEDLLSKKARRVLFYDCFLDTKGDKVIREVTGDKFCDLKHPYFVPPILGYSPISKVYVERFKNKDGKKSDCIFKTMKELRFLRKSHTPLRNTMI